MRWELVDDEQGVRIQPVAGRMVRTEDIEYARMAAEVLSATSDRAPEDNWLENTALKQLSGEFAEPARKLRRLGVAVLRLMLRYLPAERSGS